MEKTMKAMVLEEYDKPLVLREVSVPVPGAGEVLIRNKANGVCFTDVKLQTGLMKDMVPSLPLILGHELSGVIEELGEGVEDFQVGDRVSLFGYAPCGECKYCRKGIPTLCDNLKGQLGMGISGGYAEYTLYPASSLVKIPEGVSFMDAAVATDAVNTSYHALCERIHLKEGDSILIMGAGGLGGNGIQIAKACGAMVIAADVDDEKLKAAKALGADYVFNTRTCDLVEEVRKVTGGKGTDYSAEFVGKPVTSKLAFSCLAKGGMQVQPGYSFGAPFEVDYTELVKREASIIGSRAGTMTSLRGSLQLIAEGKLKPQIDETAIVPLERVNEILDRLKKGDVVGRGVVTYE